MPYSNRTTSFAAVGLSLLCLVIILAETKESSEDEQPEWDPREFPLTKYTLYILAVYEKKLF